MSLNRRDAGKGYEKEDELTLLRNLISSNPSMSKEYHTISTVIHTRNPNTTKSTKSNAYQGEKNR
jgi:hypothetical protein